MGFAKILGVSEVKKNLPWLVAACFAEIVGNFFLNFLGTGSIVPILVAPGPGEAAKYALTFGWTVIVLVTMFGGISGGHFNPAVTIAMMSTCRVPITRGVLYIVCQIFGAILGSMFLKAVTPEQCHGIKCALGATMVSQHISVMQGLVVEIILGFFLVLILFGVSDPNRNVAVHTPMAVGVAVFVGHLASLDYTGSSMNPARTIGAALSSGQFDDIWIYLFGPIIGGLLAAFLYKYVLSANGPAASDEQTEQV